MESPSTRILYNCDNIMQASTATKPVNTNTYGQLANESARMAQPISPYAKAIKIVHPISLSPSTSKL